MKKDGLAFWLLALIILIVTIGDFAKIMISQNHNDHMYIGASALISQSKTPYAEFTFTQTPYLPLLYGNLYRLFRLVGIDSYYLLIGRLFSFACLGMSAVILYVIVRRLVGTIFPPLCIVALFLLNKTVVDPATEVSNYILPIALSFLGFHLFTGSLRDGKPRSFRVVLSGLFIAITIGTKLTYAAVALSFVAFIFISPLVSKRSGCSIPAHVFNLLFPFSIGLVIGLLPLIFYMLSDPAAVIYNNWGYHMVNARWRQATGYAMPMSLGSKVAFAYRMFSTADNLILALGILLGLAFALPRAKGLAQLPAGAFLALILFLVGVPTALAPTPSFPQYYAVPVSFMFLLLGYSSSLHALEIATLQRRTLFLLVLATLLNRGPELLEATSRLRWQENWSALRVHEVAMNVRKALVDNRISAGKVATLSPLFALEANLAIYDELSAGPFFYRSGDLLAADQRKRFVITSPNSIGSLLAEDPPSAIIVGYEEKLDEPLLEYAIQNKYREISVTGLGGRCFLVGRP